MKRLPVKLSALLIVSTIFLSTCSDENESGKKLTPTTEYYFIGEVGKRQILFEEKDNLTFIGGFSDYGLNQSCYASYKTSLYKVSDDGIQLIVQLSFYNVAHVQGPCDESDLNEAFLTELVPGDYHLSWLKNNTITVGIVYYDSSTFIGWNSAEKEQPDGKSFFTVDKSEPLGVDDAGRRLQKVEGRFSAYLYKYDYESQTVTDSIFMSNAKFVFRFMTE